MEGILQAVIGNIPAFGQTRNNLGIAVRAHLNIYQTIKNVKRHLVVLGSFLHIRSLNICVQSRNQVTGGIHIHTLYLGRALVLSACSIICCIGSFAAAAAGQCSCSQRTGEGDCNNFCAIYHKIFLLLFKTFSQLPKAVLHQGRLLLSYHNRVQNATRRPPVLRIFNRPCFPLRPASAAGQRRPQGTGRSAG